MSWPKRTIAWIEAGSAYVSVPFTWELPKAYQICVWYKTQGYRVRAGGPAVSLIPEYLSSVGEIGGEIDALPHHNPQATFTSRGCPNHCAFCAVPRIEGDLKELKGWEPRPVVCDNNLLACSRTHFDRVVDRLKPLKGIDFNQGLDKRLLKPYHIDRLRELNLKMVRLAWDSVKEERITIDTINALLAAGLPPRKIHVYVLVNFRDTPADAVYRCETLSAMGVLPWPQRYNPLDTFKKNSYLALGWEEKWLRKFMRFWSRQVWLGHVSLEEYTRRKDKGYVASLPLERS